MEEKKRVLYGRALCPHARRLMLGLSEKKLPFVFEMKMSDMNDDSLPVLVDLNDQMLSGTYAITEYLEEIYKDKILMGFSFAESAEVRRLIQWCETTLMYNVTNPFVFERVHKFIWRLGSARHRELMMIRKELDDYLQLIESILQERNWFAGESMTWADLTLAAHISCLDFLGEIIWKNYDGLYMWYLRMKSRPSFTMILHEEIPGLQPAKQYRLLDFDK